MTNRKQKQLNDFLEEIDRVWQLSLNEKELLEDTLDILFKQDNNYSNLLSTIPENKVRKFASGWLDMIEQDDCDDCEEFDIDSVSDYDLIEEFRYRGLNITIKEKDIVTEAQLEEMNELFLSFPAHKRENIINDLKNTI